MQRFAYERPATLREAVALLEANGPDARVLAGGTDLIIGLRNRAVTPRVVVDVKRIAELSAEIRDDGDHVTLGALTTMTQLTTSPLIRDRYCALAEAAGVVGSVQIRNRATIAGNICNASPAADTAPAMLVFGATVLVAGPTGERRIPLVDFFVRSGVTTLQRGELVVAIELPNPEHAMGSAHLRRTRRRGHDLASVTLSCAVDDAGTTRIAYGSVGPRPFLVEDATGVVAGRAGSAEDRSRLLDEMLGAASPSPRSMRASPDYRLAMLRVLAERGVQMARGRIDERGGAGTGRVANGLAED